MSTTVKVQDWYLSTLKQEIIDRRKPEEIQEFEELLAKGVDLENLHNNLQVGDQARVMASYYFLRAQAWDEVKEWVNKNPPVYHTVRNLKLDAFAMKRLRILDETFYNAKLSCRGNQLLDLLQIQDDVVKSAWIFLQYYHRCLEW